MSDAINDSEKVMKDLFKKPAFALPFREAQPVVGLHNLPHLLTELIGRDAECKMLCQLLETERLVTIVGPGGVGKTHLAVQVARQNIGRFSYGVYLVPLAAVVDPESLVFVIADALHFSFYSPFDSKQQLFNYLADKKLLLVMDNFEHLLPAAELLADLLQAAPEVQILATSRERLGLHGESIFDLQSLAYPPESEEPFKIKDYGAVQLFLQSARRSQPAFLPSSEDDWRSMGHICRLVGGLPLAVDISAAWVRALAVGEIALEVERGLDFLTSPWRDTPERHRSLRVVFDTSWQMLSPAEQEILAKLSVFPGDFTRQAAMQVAGANLGALSDLVEKSFLRWDGAAARYFLHPLVEQYAAEQLAAQPDVADSVREKYANYFADFLSEMWQVFHGSGHRMALQQIAMERENIRRIWAWAIQQAQWHVFEKGMNALCRFYKVHGPLQNGLDMVNAAIQGLQTSANALSDNEKILARLKVRRAEFLIALSDPEGRQQIGECLPTLQRLALHWERVNCLLLLSSQELQQGEYDFACQSYEQALALAQQEHFPDLETNSLNGLGTICLMRRQFERAKTYLEQSLAIARQIGSSLHEAVQLANLSQVALLQKDYDLARRFGDQAIRLVRDAGDTSWEAGLLYTMGDAQYRQGNYQLSDAYYQQSMQIFSMLGNYKWEMILLLRLGRNARVLGDFDVAKEYFDQVARIQTRFKNRQTEMFWLDSLGVFYRVLGDYSQAEALEERALQAARSVGDRYVEVLALKHLSQLVRDTGDAEKAIAYGSEVQALAEKLGDFASQADAWCVIGDAKATLQSLTDAADAYQKAFDLGQQADDVALVMMALAGLSSMSLKQNALSKALEYVEQIVDALSDGGLTRVEEPIKVYWVCYQVLLARYDPRAEELLREGSRLLQERAAKIADERLRRSFLENVAAHRELMAAFRRQEAQTHQPASQDDDAPIDALSEREIEVLRLIAAGLTNQQICEALYLSLNTVKTHSRHLFRKLGVSSRTQAIRYAHERGLMP